MKIKHQKVTKIVLALFFIVFSSGWLSYSAHATSWTGPVVSSSTQLFPEESYQDTPIEMTVQIKGLPLSYPASVTKGLHIWLARYIDTQTSRTYWAVKSPYDQYFVNLTGVPNDSISLVAGTDTLMWEQYTGNYNYGGLVTTRDGWKALSLSFADGKPFYSLNSTKAKQWFVTTDFNDSPTQLRVLSRAVSPNGRYVLAWLNYSYYVRLDLDTNNIQYIGHFQGAWYGGPSSNPYAGAITSDGRYSFIYGGPHVADLGGCNISLTEVQIVEGFNGTNLPECPVTHLAEAVQEKVGYAGYDSNYHWSGDGESLVFFINPFPYTSGSTGQAAKVTLRLNAEQASTIQYLALGDSYSSGEGDVEKDSVTNRNYYLPLTDIGKDSCHISSRSYPFLLRDYWGVNPTNMKSVACSGAQVVMDYDRPLDGYLGQSGRLRGRSDIGQAKEIALNRYLPGRVPQLEFIRKYKPNVITLTGGGNDVGFANMLGYCAYGSPDVDTNWKLIQEGFYGLFTCDYAKPNSIVQKLALKSIKDQYIYTVNLLKQIKVYDPEAKVYMIGYPSFISSGTAICANSLELDSDERAAIQYYLELLNDSLRRASNFEGVEYIDISQSLEGGRLCEGSEFMTGPWSVNITDQLEMQNLFHPNALGHQKIANKIYSTVSNPISRGGESAPTRPLSVGDSEYLGQVQNMTITSSDLPRNGAITVNTDAYLFMPLSDVQLTLHSSPIDLGILKTGAEGSLDQRVNLHNLPAGYHVLTLEGVAYSGEALTVYQFVTVGLNEDRSLLSPVDQNDSIGFGSAVNKSISKENQPNQIPQNIASTEHVIESSGWQAKDNHWSDDEEKKKLSLWLFRGLGLLLILTILYIYRRVNNAKTAR